MFGYTLQELLSGLALLLGGAGLGLVLRFIIQYRRVNLEKEGAEREAGRVDFSTILAEVKAQRDEAWAHAAKQDERINQMEAEIQGLRLARDLDPFPNWIVDRSGEYLFVNREFERLFLEPRNQTYRDIVGKKHEDVWPPQFCRTLRSLDAAARSRPDGTARATTQVDIPNLGAARITVHKFPIRFKPAGVIVAYAGFITDIEPVGALVGEPE